MHFPHRIMRIVALGSAAGGGLPQWNCGCPNCDSARAKRIPSRTTAALAASGDGERWVLVNAGADIGAQFASTPSLRPALRRESPLAALLLTDANIDHVAGLLEFRQAAKLDIFSTRLVKTTLCDAAMFGQFDARYSWHTFDAVAGRVLVARFGGQLDVWAIPVSGRLPSYAGGAPADGAAVAFVLAQGNARVLYAPIFLELDAALEGELAQADAAFLDGTFWSDEEMVDLGLGSRTSREMGHAPLSGPGGSLERVAGTGAKRRYVTHVNNSNPILDPASAAAHELARAGFAVCDDGLEIEL